MAPNDDPTQSSFPLMELPPELRSYIFNEVAKDTKAWLALDGSSRLICPRSLSSTSKQVRGEFSASLYLSANRVNFKVENFEFGKVHAFLNNLTDAEFHEITRNTQSGIRKYCILITITELPLRGDEGLKEWFKCIDKSSKKGLGINFSYEVSKAYEDIITCGGSRLLQHWMEFTRSWSKTLRSAEHYERLTAALRRAEHSVHA